MSKVSPLADDARPFHLHLDPIVRMHLLEPAAAELLRFAAAGVVEPLPAQVVGVAVAQAGPDHLRQRFRQRLEARAILAQLLHGFAVLGDVDAGADEAHELAVGPDMRTAAFEQPAPRAVVALQAELHFVGPARVERGVIGVERAVEIRRVQVVAPAVADLLLDVAADEIEPALVEPRAALVLAAHPDEHRRRVRRGAEALLALAQRGFGAIAAGDVADESAEHEVVAEADRRDREFDGEFGAVAMHRRHLDALVQHARDAGFHVAMQAAAMLLAQALGDDELGELAAQRLGACPAEHLLGVRIPAGDDSLVVDRDHAVERGLDDELVALLGEAQRTLGRASRGVGAFAARGVDQHEGRRTRRRSTARTPTPRLRIPRCRLRSKCSVSAPASSGTRMAAGSSRRAMRHRRLCSPAASRCRRRDAA